MPRVTLSDSVQTAAVVVSSLIEAGVRHFVYCPGSRVAPLAFVLERIEASEVLLSRATVAAEVTVQVCLEERSGGFYAVGVAAATDAPVAVLTTSGTAVAELLPAFLEAKHQGLCLVAVSADRPFELQDTASSQTTRQTGLLVDDALCLVDVPALNLATDTATTGTDHLGSHHLAYRNFPLQQKEIALPEQRVTTQQDPWEQSGLSPVLLGVRNRILHLLQYGGGAYGPKKPVHLNLGFRPPLIPVADESESHYAGELDRLILKCLTNPTGNYPGKSRKQKPQNFNQQKSKIVDKNSKIFQENHKFIPNYPVNYPNFFENCKPKELCFSDLVDPDLSTVVLAADGADETVLAEATLRQIPIFAEPTALARMSSDSALVPHAPALLNAWLELIYKQGANLGKSEGNPFTIEQVVLTGRPTLSRLLIQVANLATVRRVIVSDTYPYPDTTATATVVVRSIRPSPYLDNCHKSSRSHPKSTGRRAEADRTNLKNYCNYNEDQLKKIGRLITFPKSSKKTITNLQAWKEFAREVTKVVVDLANSDLNHLSVARAIWQSKGVLFLGASNTIRAFDQAVSNTRTEPAYSNRGLAGIDGTIACARGILQGLNQVAKLRPKPGLRVVLGDNSFSYDLASLVCLTNPDQLEENLQIIVLNDKSASIFTSLEYGRPAYQQVLERYFTPASIYDLVSLANACGWKAQSISTLEELKLALQKPILDRSLLEVKVYDPTSLFNKLKEKTKEILDKILIENSFV